MVSKALRKDGLVIIGVHNPLINPKYSEYSYYLRSSIRIKASKPFTNEIRRYLYRKDHASFYSYDEEGQFKGVDLTKAVHLGWLREKSHHFHEGNGGDLLDYGIMRGNRESFLKLCAGGAGSSRPVDLILSGHVHKNWECRVKWDDNPDKFKIYHDFYTENPKVYYHSYDSDEYNSAIKRIHVTIHKNAKDNPKPVKGSSGVWSIKTKPNSPTLNSQKDGVGKNLWWMGLRPFLLQTAAVGPSEWLRAPEKQPDFRGCRVITVKSDKIKSINYITNSNIKSELTRYPDRPDDEGTL
jgi:hypothetical protein